MNWWVFGLLIGLAILAFGLLFWWAFRMAASV